MKKFYLIILISFISYETQSQCNTYFNFKEGAEYEMTHYSDKDKVTGKSLSQILSVDDNGGVLTAHIKGTAFDKKGEEITSMNFEYICDDGVLKMDMNKFIPKDMFGSDAEIDFEMEGDYLELPENLEIGQSLKDGMIEGKMTMEGNPAMANMGISVKIFNRQVEAIEDITTPAGSFTCYKISYDMESSTKVMGMNNKVTMKGIDYMSEGVGVIKTESYNKKGDLSSYSLLTGYK
jgi:hypothetical protein